MLLFQSQTGVIHPRLQANNPWLSLRKSWKSMKDSYATSPHISATSRHITPHPSTKTITKLHLHQLATTRGIGSTPDPLLRRLQGISRTADLKHIWSDFGTAVNLMALKLERSELNINSTCFKVQVRTPQIQKHSKKNHLITFVRLPIHVKSESFRADLVLHQHGIRARIAEDTVV